MRIVVALGGNALLRRGEALTAHNQRQNVRVAARALAPIAREHQLVISHGNGPQVGLLALQAAAFSDVEAYPLDVLGAQTEGMIGYMIEQELGNLVPFEVPFATILTMVEVDPADPAFQNPTKPIGPFYGRAEAERLQRRQGLDDGRRRRRLAAGGAVAAPKRIFEIRPIRWLLERGRDRRLHRRRRHPDHVRSRTGKLRGAEVVIDKDRASAVLARELAADLLVMATDAAGVFLDWGGPPPVCCAPASVAELRAHDFASGSMGPKVEAACSFVEETGKRAAIGALEDLERIVAGEAGTIISGESR